MTRCLKQIKDRSVSNRIARPSDWAWRRIRRRDNDLCHAEAADAILAQRAEVSPSEMSDDELRQRLRAVIEVTYSASAQSGARCFGTAHRVVVGKLSRGRQDV